MNAARAKRRLDYLRKEIEAERISYGELAELQSLVDYIDPDDAQLLEWAGVEEKNRYRKKNRLGTGGKMNKEKRLVAAKQLLALAKELTAAEDEEGDDEVDEQMAGRIRNIRMKLNKMGQKKTRKLNTFGVDIIRPSDTVETLIGAIEKVLSGIK